MLNIPHLLVYAALPPPSNLRHTEALRTMPTGATPQVISTDRHTVKPWFQGRLTFSFNLSDATALFPDTTLKGADLTLLHAQSPA